MKPTAKIRKIEGHGYVVAQIVDGVEQVSEVCKIVDEGKTIALPANDSNRKYFNINKFEEAKDENGEMPLTYKASIKLGDRPARIPNEKLISYLPEDLQAEYRAIIDRAMAAREEAKAKPMTDLEKAQAKLERAKAALAKLEAEAAEKEAE